MLELPAETGPTNGRFISSSSVLNQSLISLFNLRVIERGVLPLTRLAFPFPHPTSGAETARVSTLQGEQNEVREAPNLGEVGGLRGDST